MDIHVTADLTWQPFADWGTTSVHVDGELSDGRRVAIMTHANVDRVGIPLRVRATHEWLHDHLLVLDEGGVPTLLVPVAELTEAVVAEALRRWLHQSRLAAA